MRRTLLIAVLSAVLLAAGVPSPAGWSASREVQDAETTTMTGDVEISSVTFTHGRRHISMRAEFASLPDYVEYYRFELHGPRGHSWSLGWAHESAQWDDHKRVKWIYLFEPTFRHLRCKVAWRQDLEAGLVTARFPTRCLRIKGKAVPWLRMQFSAEDIYEDSHIQDWAPGGNSNNGDPGRFTKRIRRG
ncbi:hypothetical protein H5V45_01960 [Nocardioides sp. KIGAM211]|uniref:PLAT domain-containing protein n=1 Tax=Nocardioides luti TaxID=2761101 RepID=A0A7X0REZ0_9ACTN|nr:hypothetical protein [Nocardioides luti]MBB6626075.1 hypothetical protein [Nocardioides luti]